MHHADSKAQINILQHLEAKLHGTEGSKGLAAPVLDLSILLMLLHGCGNQPRSFSFSSGPLMSATKGQFHATPLLDLRAVHDNVRELRELLPQEEFPQQPLSFKKNTKKYGPLCLQT